MFSDFTKAYYPAAESLFSHDAGAALVNSYQKGAQGFVNLPILAYLFTPLVLFPPTPAGYVMLFFGVIAMLGLWYILSRLAGLDGDRSLLLLFFFAANGPLLNSLRYGNTTHFVLLLIVLGICALRKERDLLAGLLIGFAALIKLPLLLLGVYFLARGRWRVAIGGASICAFAGILSLLVFGWDVHQNWYEYTIKPFAEKPLSAYNNQSVQGFLTRLDHGKSYLMNWQPKPVDPMILLASKAAVFLLLGTVAVVIGWPRRWRRGSGIDAPATTMVELEICIIILLAMMISTVSWSHYYLWILLPAAFVIGGNFPAMASGKMRFFGWAALIGAMPPLLIDKTGIPSVFSRPYAYVLVSHYFLSAGLLLVVLLLSHWRGRSLAVSHRGEATDGTLCP